MASAQKRASKEEEDKINDLTNRIISVITNIPIHDPIRGQVKGLTRKQMSELGKLTLEDFELMRENHKIKNMMAKLLEMDVTKLTKVVTVAKGYKKQLDSSASRKAKSLSLKDVVPTFLTAIPGRPASARPAISARPASARPAISARPASARPAISAMLRTPIYMLPRDIMLKIKEDLKSLIEYKLYEGIPLTKLNNHALSKNYYVIDYLKKNPALIDYKGLSENRNPKAIKLLREEIARAKKEGRPDRIVWRELSKNQYAMDLLNENDTKIDWETFCGNPHPDTISILKRKINEDPYNKERYLYWSSLSSNTSDQAIEYLKEEENYGKIDWRVLSDNTNLKAIELLKVKAETPEGRNDLYWFGICRNKNAMDIIEEANRKYSSEITWSTLVNNTNPRAIVIIKDMLKEDSTKIKWFELSPNPSAIEILLENKENIVWSTFSGNTSINHPKAMKLLIEIIKSEEEGNEKNKIAWHVLSANPSIFRLC